MDEAFRGLPTAALTALLGLWGVFPAQAQVLPPGPGPHLASPQALPPYPLAASQQTYGGAGVTGLGSGADPSAGGMPGVPTGVAPGAGEGPAGPAGGEAAPGFNPAPDLALGRTAGSASGGLGNAPVMFGDHGPTFIPETPHQPAR